MFKVSPLRKRQFIGGVIGLVIGIIIFQILNLEATEQYRSIGPMNTGHEDISCLACHTDAKGNLLQQVQSNISHLVGVSKEGVSFGTEDVTSDNCLQCHDRPNDRHPIYRFSEPRFSDAVKNIDATNCITCHVEHHEERVSISPVNYCMNCHQDLDIENDPLDISHKDIIEKEAWLTCIQCHDFHGNHRYTVPEKLTDTIPMKVLNDYFNGGKDPYGNDKKYTALSFDAWLKTLEN